MKKNRLFSKVLVLFLFISIGFCSCHKVESTYSPESIFDEWYIINANFYSGNFDKSLFIEQVSSFKNTIESSFFADTNAYPDIRVANTTLIDELTDNLNQLLNVLKRERSYEKDANQLMIQIGLKISLIEHNEYLSLKKTNYQYVQFFVLLIISCVLIITFLIYFNNKELKHKQNQLDASKTYLKYVISTQESERSRISRELHDTVAQDMRYVGLLAGKLPDNDIAAEVQKMQSDCINQIRNLCYNFAPPDIKTGNLKEALQTLVTEVVQRTNLDLRLTVLDNVDFSVFQPDELLHFYRIVQEALSNIKKHSNATEATILFRYDEVDGKKIYKLVITDDGIGINSELLDKINNQNSLIKKEDGNHFGISGMKERVALLNGTIHFDSIPDEGTEIVVSVEK